MSERDAALVNQAVAEWGAQGLVHAWQIAAPLLLIVTLTLTLPEIGADWRKLLTALVPSVIASGAMAAMVYIAARFTGGLPAPTELAILVAFGAACYLGLLWIFSRQTLQQIMDLVFRRKIAVA